MPKFMICRETTPECVALLNNDFAEYVFSRKGVRNTYVQLRIFAQSLFDELISIELFLKNCFDVLLLFKRGSIQ